MSNLHERLDADQVLSRLNQWMRDTQLEAEVIDGTEDNLAVQPVGMLQMVEQLTAIRQEVKLLTKAVRGTEERGESTLLALQAAIDQMRTVAPAGNEANGSTREMLEVLVDLDDALRRERTAIEAARQHALQGSARDINEIRDALQQLYRTQAWWRRILCRPWYRATLLMFSERTIEQHQKLFDALLEGHDLVHGRLIRGLRELEILRIECVGRIVDPHCMNVVEVISDPLRPGGLVVEEIRGGYYWGHKVFRFAEVKAVAATS